MSIGKVRVLFIGNGNAARSQIAEALLRSLSDGKIDVFSAGSDPLPDIHPLTRRVLAEGYHLDVSGHHPKPFDLFLDQAFDYIIAVCSRTAQLCPVFPNDPVRINWFYDELVTLSGPEPECYRAFDMVARELTMRMRTWMQLPQIASRLSG